MFFCQGLIERRRATRRFIEWHAGKNGCVWSRLSNGTTTEAVPLRNAVDVGSRGSQTLGVCSTFFQRLLPMVVWKLDLNRPDRALHTSVSCWDSLGRTRLKLVLSAENKSHFMCGKQRLRLLFAWRKFAHCLKETSHKCLDQNHMHSIE